MTIPKIIFRHSFPGGCSGHGMSGQALEHLLLALMSYRGTSETSKGLHLHGDPLGTVRLGVRGLVPGACRLSLLIKGNQTVSMCFFSSQLPLIIYVSQQPPKSLRKIRGFKPWEDEHSSKLIPSFVSQEEHYPVCLPESTEGCL